MSTRTDSAVATGSVTLVRQLLFLFLVAWFMSATTASALGVFENNQGPPIALGLFVLVPTLALVGAYRLSPLVREAARSIPLEQLTAAHVLRIEGGLFVVGALMGNLPGLFGYVAGIGDVMAAIFAIPLAVALAKGDRSPALRARFATWNAFGLLDLVTAITLGILHSPSPLGLLRGSTSTALFGHLPSSLVPTFFVPAFIVTHLLVWTRLRDEFGAEK